MPRTTNSITTVQTSLDQQAEGEGKFYPASVSFEPFFGQQRKGVSSSSSFHLKLTI